MAYKNRAEARCLIELGFEWENTEHQINRLGHLRNATPVPRPNLRADVINNFQLWKFRAQRTGEAQIKSRVIDQHDCAWPRSINLGNGGLKLLSKKRVTPDHFP